MTAPAISLLQKLDIFFRSLVLHELLINGKLPIFIAATVADYIVNGSLGKVKTGSIFELSTEDLCFLHFLGGQENFIRCQPCVQ